MNEFYSKYGFQDVIGLDWERGSSAMFRKWCFKGYIRHLGYARNVSRTYARSVKQNLSFQNFLVMRGLPIPRDYEMAKCSMDACFKSFSKYDKGEPFLREILFRRACSWTARRYAPIMGCSKVKSTVEVLVDMDKTTSCGYPWNIKFKNKTEMLSDPHVSCALEDFWNEISKIDCKIQAIWKVAQKNELLPTEKVADGKVRTFTAAPIELSVAANRLFLDQNKKMNDHNILNNPSSTSFVGASKYASGWNRLYKRLDKFKIAYELDESSYDASVFKELFVFLKNFRLSCIDVSGMSDVEKLHLETRVNHVYSSIVNSIVVLENGELVDKSTGNPSGSTNTINDNTLALDVLFNYAWLCSCEDSGRQTDYDDFNDCVCPAYNGDDNTYTCAAECVALIEPKKVKSYWDNIGVTTRTPSDVGRALNEVSFLSHSFHWDDVSHKYYPRPDRVKVLCSLLYASSLQDVRWHYLRACALRIESYWDAECRNLLFGYICYLEQNYMSDLNGVVKELKWEHIRALFMTDEDIETLYDGKEASNGLDPETMDMIVRRFGLAYENS